jgi:hypothetical protein
MAYECARRIRQFTGIDCLILTSEDRENGYSLKFELARLAGGRVFIFADADWWAIKPFSVQEFIGLDGMAMVRDPAATHESNQFPATDSVALGFPPSRYSNTGFFVANSQDSRVIQAFDKGHVLMQEKHAGLHPGVRDSTEQSMFNKALFDCQLPTQFLPAKFNTYYYSVPAGLITSIPADMVAVHAAGVPLERKMEWLQIQVKAWEIYH